MKRFLGARNRAIMALVLTASLIVSCTGSGYKIFSLREGIGHFSIEYPSTYTVTRIDIRNDEINRYTDVGFRDISNTDSTTLKEISIYTWPADGDETAVLILDNMLAQAGTIFQDFELLQRFSVMIGDMEGQAASFSWTASPADSSIKLDESALPAVSTIVCFRHGDLAWEIHVASDTDSQAEAEAVFKHVLETFQILN
jgi:hypothetical protein